MKVLDYRYDSSGKRVYHMFCSSCSADRGYQRPSKRFLECKSCAQTGKKSEKKGKQLSAEHRNKISKANTKWRTELDPNYRKLTCNDKRILHNIRCRLWQVVKGNPESFSKSLGCKTYQLRYHLESKFEPWMSWNNYGSEWEIDHIKPLSSFDLTDSEQFKKACYYTNLQPISVTYNRSKGAKYDKDE